MVERIEEYRQKNGVDILKVVLKPTKKFPEGKNYFYAPSDAIDLVRKYTWHLSAQGKNRVCVMAHDNNSAYFQLGRRHYDNMYFHTKLFELYNNYKWQGDIDHINLVEIDNIDANLNAVTSQQNQFNHFTRGYMIDTRWKPASFTACIRINGKDYRPYSAVRNEAEACNIQNYLEQVWLKKELRNRYYMFNFKKYRRGSQDLLDLERTGKISEEEAIYQHILRYSNNAWYYYRYGLQDYFKQYHIPVPQYRLDEYGFMTHSITGQKLCPF